MISTSSILTRKVFFNSLIKFCTNISGAEALAVKPTLLRFLNLLRLNISKFSIFF